MMEKKPEENKPVIRFAGFTDAWEQRKLGEIADVTKLAGFEFTEHVVYSDEGNIIALRGLNVKNGTLVLDDVKYIDNSNFPKLERSKLYEGDVLFTYVGTVGELAKIQENERFYLAPNVSRIRFDNEYNPNFMMQQMERKSFYQGTILPLIATSSQPALSMENIRKLLVMVPKQREEQAKVGEYFRIFDHLITLHQRKCDELQRLKKFMLKKMFPQNGANIPEIRFTGFIDVWEQRKLGELMNVTSVKRIHQSDWTDSGVRFLRARDIVSAAKNEESDDCLYISKEKYEEYSAISGKVAIDDMLVTGVGTIGVPYLVRNLEPLYFKDGNIIWFQNDGKIDGNFFYYSFWGSKIQGFINESSGTGTVGTYTIESGKKTPILLPDKSEQQKIGSYFAALDHLITLHQRQLTLLKQIKKAYLEKMFV